MSQRLDKWGEMNFEVNGQSYILTFLPEEGSFALFEPNNRGMKRLKIVHDEGPTWIVTADQNPEDAEKPRLN